MLKSKDLFMRQVLLHTVILYHFQKWKIVLGNLYHHMQLPNMLMNCMQISLVQRTV